MNKASFRVLVLGLGLILAFIGAAFKAKSTITTTYWFEVSADGEDIISYHGTTATGCNEPSGDYCLLGFEAEDIEDPNAMTPELKEEVEADPLSYEDDQRYKE
jgi:hypothetical protein